MLMSKSINIDSLRFILFLLGLVSFSLIGVIVPFRREEKFLNRFRWFNNVLLSFINTAISRVLVPGGVLLVSGYCQEQKIGVFHWLYFPSVLNFIFSIILMDLTIYYQHRCFHRFNLLWLLHRVHHSDPGFDTSTALRFHPFEILISLGIKAATILIFGVNPAGYVTFEILLNFSAMFNHANFALPANIENKVRSLVVTPDMHRIHHSVENYEMNKNFGFCLSIWDKLFGTYLKSGKGLYKDQNQIGLSQFRDKKGQRIDKLIIQPFRK